MSAEWTDAQKRYYDAFAQEYEKSFQQGNPYFEFVTEHWLEAIRPRAGERVLEFGASGGRFTMPLLEAGCRVTGVDLSPECLHYFERRMAAHPRKEHLTLREGDVTFLTQVEESGFDVVIGAHILHHVEDFGEALAQGCARLRSGGRSVFLEPNPWNLQWYAQNTFGRRRNWGIERGLLRVWPERVRRAFLTAGFRTCEVKTFGCFPPFVHNHFPACRRIESFLERHRSLAWWLTLNLYVAYKA
ncbi:MAG: class I SAM-dependent methyltransferase [Elusimicrobiota bacterium]